jgi:hypothetical protein
MRRRKILSPPDMGMPPKLEPDSDTQRISIVAPTTLIRRIDAWRREEPDIPNVSQAIRRLIELGLEAAKKRKR